MKWLLWGLILLKIFPCLAEEADEQTLFTQDKTCAIHYLTPKQKKLWTITVDEGYCQKGWVNGFTTVLIKDSLDRTAHELKGFFHQGYWLSDFPGVIEDIKRLTPKKGIQNLLFKIQSDKSVDFYWVTESSLTDGEYPVFNICPKHPTLMAVHEPATDFGQSTFQTQILKVAQNLLKQQCPSAQEFTLVGGTQQILSEKDGPFHANINIPAEETTVSFTSPIPIKEKLHPTELRREAAENLITIHPEIISETETSEETVSNNTPPISPLSDISNLSQIQSAVDMALIAHILKSPVQGKVVLYIDSSESAHELTVTRPLPLNLKTTHPIQKGWHLITGVFKPQKDATEIHILSAIPCLKEWCADEN